jgi:TolB-like protein
MTSSSIPAAASCRGNTMVAAEPQVFDLLEYLIRSRERVVSRDDLLAAVWRGRNVSDATLSSRINAARVAIGDNGEKQRLIRTLPRKGIRFVGEVREEIDLPGEAAATRESATPRIAALEGPSIAVLPFTNMSGDPEQEYFADGMAEDIITALSRISRLLVIARNSSFTYKGKSVDIREVGRELGVKYVLEGSVRRSGGRLRISGQLIDAASGAHLWADRFDGDASDVFELQDRITESVVAAIEPTLQVAEVERRRNSRPRELDAYDLVLRAYSLRYEFTPERIAAALDCLDQALTIDPNYAPATAAAPIATRCAIFRAGCATTMPIAPRPLHSPGARSSSRPATRRCSGWRRSRSGTWPKTGSQRLNCLTARSPSTQIRRWR